MTYLLTEVADRERLANQARAISLGTWAASILLIGFALAPSIRSNPLMKAVLIFAGCGMTAVSRATAGNLAMHDRVLQDFRDISDNQRQQLIYESLSPRQLLKPADASTEASALAALLPVHNLSQAISQTAQKHRPTRSPPSRKRLCDGQSHTVTTEHRRPVADRPERRPERVLLLVAHSLSASVAGLT